MVGPSILIQLQRATGLLATEMKPTTSKQLPVSRNVFLFFLMQFVLAFCIISYTQTSKTYGTILCSTAKNESTVEARREKNVQILVWTWPFGGTFPLDKCEEYLGISGCILTVNRSLYDQADAVVLHSRDVCNSKKQLPPLARPPNQRWLWLTLESPSHNPNVWFVDNLINLTMTYRRDSDIFTPYGWIEKLKNPQNFSIPTKTKLVAWVVSNWNPWSKRVQYFQELQKHIQVDVYGRNHLPLVRSEEKTRISQYKFYLAFENSQHQDYITEKLWKNALLSGAVPIVLGTTRENYERFIPAEAFIHVDDFPSAKEMAAYLKVLDSDNEKYMRYFDWRKQHIVVGHTSWVMHYCKACRYLKQNPTYKTIRSVAKWFK